MPDRKSIPGLIFTVIFMLFWISGTLYMGFMFLDFSSSWPSEMPGLHPSIFTFVPFLMSAFGILMLGGIIVGFFRNSSEMKPDHHITKIMNPSYDSTGDSMTTGRRGRYTGYDIPEYCDKCGIRLDISEVEWIGPVTFKCTKCHEVHKAIQIHI